MKKKLRLFGFSILVITVLVITSAGTQQEKEKNKKEQKQNNTGKQDKKDKPENAQKNNKAQAPGQQNKSENPGNSDDRSKKGNNAGSNNAINNNKDNKGVKNDYVLTDGFKWDHESFKERDKYRKQEKVTICHKVNNDAEPAVTIKVSKNALKAHMNHGDVMGECPQINNSRYSDIFLRNRADYYNTLQNHYEQVTYSQSILDYALARLANSRQQLITMRNSNMPEADIQRKQAAVVELEQNVSLLESLIGVAVNLVVNKLQ